MGWHSWYYLWTTGNFTASTTISLDVARRYLVTGGLTLRNGDDDAHVYISTVCTGSGPILCGVRDTSRHVDLGLNEPLPAGAGSVTIKLRTTGGRHRAEGFVYEV